MPRLFPEERAAVWGDPCEDKRHLEIWSESKACDRLPQVGQPLFYGVVGV